MSHILSTYLYLQSTQHAPAKVSRKRPRPVTEWDSDSDDYVPSASEFKRARTKARYLRRRFEEVIREKAQLTGIIGTMSRTINGQFATRKYKYADMMSLRVHGTLMSLVFRTGDAFDRKGFRYLIF